VNGRGREGAGSAKERRREIERMRVGGEMKVCLNKIFDWEATVLPNQKIYI
jgi:hypothetical protein